MKNKSYLILFLLFILIVSVFLSSQRRTQQTESVKGEIGSTEKATGLGKGDLSVENQRQRFFVTRVVDGDTVMLDTGEKLRYIGIDTPETKHPRKPVEYFGKEASAVNTKLVSGKDILVEFDVVKRDKYGRLLGYVFLPDGTFINAELVKQGYAKVYTYPPNVRYAALFRQLQAEAVKQRRGLWSNRKIEE
jgi:micrococcal nuclease